VDVNLYLSISAALVTAKVVEMFLVAGAMKLQNLSQNREAREVERQFNELAKVMAQDAPDTPESK